MSEELFKLSVNSDTISINGFTFAPAEAETITALVSFAGGMQEFSALPPFIESGQFKIHFSEDGTLKLTGEVRQNEIVFTFKTIDILISKVNDAVQMSVDYKRHRPTVRNPGGFDTSNSGLLY